MSNDVVVVETEARITVIGDVGPKGDKGNAATVAVGTVTTGAAGSSATVTNAGTANDAVLNFAIPQGIQGIQGPQGIQGIQGIQGPQGVKGDTGTVAVGTVTTGAAGSSASVTNAGTATAAIFNFTIPQGASVISETVNQPKTRPTLMVNFVRSRQMDARVTFTRASAATYFDSNGALQMAAVNAPRFDYDPVTKAARGLLIEGAVTNMLLRSEEFDHSTWAKSNATVTANATANPLGGVTADTLVEAATSTEHGVTQAFSPAITTQYTLSVFAKAGARSRIRLGFSSAGNWANGARFCTFNLATGLIVAAPAAPSSASITTLPNGWYRVSLTATSGATTAASNTQIHLDDGTTTNYLGDGTSGLFIWGAMLEQAATPSSYTPGTRAADVATLPAGSWFNAAEGTMLAEGLLGRQATIDGTRIADLHNGTANGTMYLAYRAAGTTGAIVATEGVSQADFTPTGAVAANQTVRLALAYKLNDFAAAGNGGTALTDVAGTVPAVTTLTLGSGPGGVALNGHVRRVCYWPSRLANNILQGITG